MSCRSTHGSGSGASAFGEPWKFAVLLAHIRARLGPLTSRAPGTRCPASTHTGEAQAQPPLKRTHMSCRVSRQPCHQRGKAHRQKQGHRGAAACAGRTSPADYKGSCIARIESQQGCTRRAHAPYNLRGKVHRQHKVLGRAARAGRIKPTNCEGRCNASKKAEARLHVLGTPALQITWEGALPVQSLRQSCTRRAHHTHKLQGKVRCGHKVSGAAARAGRTWQSSWTATGAASSPVAVMRTTTVSARPSSSSFCEPPAQGLPDSVTSRICCGEFTDCITAARHA